MNCTHCHHPHRVDYLGKCERCYAYGLFDKSPPTPQQVRHVPGTCASCKAASLVSLTDTKPCLRCHLIATYYSDWQNSKITLQLPLSL